MLVVVPYLIQHPGTTLQQSSDLFAIPVPQLRRDLEQLFLAGLPPYGPGDLIDVDIDEDGGIWISMADHFARPLRLTRQEALAVYVRATELRGDARACPVAPALAAALGEAPRRRSGPETLGEAAGIAGGRARRGADRSLDAVRAAAARHTSASGSTYVAQSTGERTDRADRARGGLRERSATGTSRPGTSTSTTSGCCGSTGSRRCDPTGERFEPRGLGGRGGPFTRRRRTTSRCGSGCVPRPGGSPSTTSPTDVGRGVGRHRST